MTVYELAKLIRQTPATIKRRCNSGDILAKRIIISKWGGWRRWEIDDNWVKNLLNKQ